MSVIFFEASHLPSDKMISWRPLIRQSHPLIKMYIRKTVIACVLLKKNCIGVIIRISWESWCLMYVGFFMCEFTPPNAMVIQTCNAGQFFGAGLQEKEKLLWDTLLGYFRMKALSIWKITFVLILDKFFLFGCRLSSSCCGCLRLSANAFFSWRARKLTLY